MGEQCVWIFWPYGIVPEFMSFTAYFNMQEGTNRAISIDYAGLGARVIRKKTAGAVSLHTKTDGLIYERPLPDGRAEVTIQLHTRNALTFVIEEPAADYDALGHPIFGYRPGQSALRADLGNVSRSSRPSALDC